MDIPGEKLIAQDEHGDMEKGQREGPTDSTNIKESEVNQSVIKDDQNQHGDPESPFTVRTIKDGHGVEVIAYPRINAVPRYRIPHPV